MTHLREQVLNELATALAPFGFHRSQRNFRRKFPDGCESFHITVIRHSTNLDFMSDVAVRHDQIEARRTGISARMKHQTVTVGAQVTTLAGAGLRRWTVEQGGDVPVVINSLLEDFHQFGNPFLQRFRTLGEVQRVFLHEPALARLICPVAAFREHILDAIHALSYE